jgi:uncharacterized glyoxalase superfamily protein PhnB
MIAKFGEMPPQEGQELSEADKEKIMHVKFPISAETVLYGSDSLTEEQVTFGNNFSISINVDSRKKQIIYLLNFLTAEMLPCHCKIHFGELISECGQIDLG